jgi:hypothetical protein
LPDTSPGLRLNLIRFTDADFATQLARVTAPSSLFDPGSEKIEFNL